jgi:hypothetical protein
MIRKRKLVAFFDGVNESSSFQDNKVYYSHTLVRGRVFCCIRVNAHINLVDGRLNLYTGRLNLDYATI